MCCLSSWCLNGLMAFGFCKGHKKYADGTYIHTGLVENYSVSEDVLKIHTLSGSCYICKVEDVLLSEVEIIKEVLRVEGVDSNFINRLEDWKVRATQTSGDDFGKVGMI